MLIKFNVSRDASHKFASFVSVFGKAHLFKNSVLPTIDFQVSFERNAVLVKNHLSLLHSVKFISSYRFQIEIFGACIST
jgi:hypothetical protein